MMKAKVIVALALLWLSLTVFANCKKEVIIFVHGSWHGEWTWFQIENLMQEQGYETVTINLPGHGIDNSKACEVKLSDYRKAIVKVLDQQSQPVILVGHSMGGVAISEAAEARPEKVKKLIYLAAFLIPSGHSMLEVAMQDSESKILPNLKINAAGGYVDLDREKVRNIFYGMSKQEFVLLSEKLLTPEPLAPLTTQLSLTNENFGSIPRYYIKTLNDNAITRKMQKAMYCRLPCKKVYYICSDHSPFFSATKRLRNILIKIANDPSIKTKNIEPPGVMFSNAF